MGFSKAGVTPNQQLPSQPEKWKLLHPLAANPEPSPPPLISTPISIHSLILSKYLPTYVGIPIPIPIPLSPPPPPLPPPQHLLHDSHHTPCPTMILCDPQQRKKKKKKKKSTIQSPSPIRARLFAPSPALSPLPHQANNSYTARRVQLRRPAHSFRHSFRQKHHYL